MIDYDTVFALRSRAPQWSYRPNWLSNFFGLEGDGQKKLLKAMINHPINHDRLSCREVYRLFDETRKEHLQQRFYDLLGMDSEQPFVCRQVSRDDFAEMVLLFEELSMKMSANFKATAPWDEDNSFLNIYDFSNFMRYAPIQIDAGLFDDTKGLELLYNSAAKLVESKVSGMPQGIEESMRRKFVVSAPELLQGLEKRALRFIEIYRKLMNEYRESRPDSWKLLLLKAFIVNEERTYMNCRPGNDTLVALVQKLKEGIFGPDEFSTRIQTIITACDRTLHKRLNGRYFSNIKLYMEGFTALLLGEDGFFQPVLAFFNGAAVSRTSYEKIMLTVEQQPFKCSSQTDSKMTYYLGPKLHFARLYGLSSNLCRFLNGDTEVTLTDISRQKATG